jgi:hypothetical protein
VPAGEGRRWGREQPRECLPLAAPCAPGVGHQGAPSRSVLQVLVVVLCPVLQVLTSAGRGSWRTTGWRRSAGDEAYGGRRAMWKVGCGWRASRRGVGAGSGQHDRDGRSGAARGGGWVGGRGGVRES